MKSHGETELVFVRAFHCAPELLYRAHLTESCLRLWLPGQGRWKMNFCVSDSRIGGQITILWSDAHGQRLLLAGEYKALVPHRKIVHVEQFCLPQPTAEVCVHTLFDPSADGARMTRTLTFKNPQARLAMLASGLVPGIEASYERLDRLLESGYEPQLQGAGCLLAQHGTGLEHARVPCPAFTHPGEAVGHEASLATEAVQLAR